MIIHCQVRFPGDQFRYPWLDRGLEHGNTLGTIIVLTDLLKAELSRLLPKFVNIETTEPEVSGKNILN